MARPGKLPGQWHFRNGLPADGLSLSCAIGPGSVMNAISQMSPPHAGHSSGNSSPTRAISFAHAIREVSWIKQHPFCKSGFSEVGHLASMVR
jgi:hypothetical protein